MTSQPGGLGHLLTDMVDAWNDQGYDLADRLAPGLTRREIDTILEPYRFAVPAELYEWFGWANGTLPGVSKELGFAGYQLFSLREALAETFRMREFYANFFLIPPGPVVSPQPETRSTGLVEIPWPAHWLVVTAWQPHLLIAMGDPLNAQIFYQDPEEQLPRQVAGSLSELVGYWTRAIREGGTLDMGGYHESPPGWCRDRGFPGGII